MGSVPPLVPFVPTLEMRKLVNRRRRRTQKENRQMISWCLFWYQRQSEATLVLPAKSTSELDAPTFEFEEIFSPTVLANLAIFLGGMLRLSYFTPCTLLPLQTAQLMTSGNQHCSTPSSPPRPSRCSGFLSGSTCAPRKVATAPASLCQSSISTVHMSTANFGLDTSWVGFGQTQTQHHRCHAGNPKKDQL